MSELQTKIYMVVKNLKLALKSQSGSLLLMSMLMLAGIITAAGTMGIITLQNLQQSIAVDQGIVSFYAAESGVEDGLYELRKKETAVASIPLSGTLNNTASWSRTITSTVESLTKDIAKNDFWEINLYDPDSSLSPLSVPIKSVTIAWQGSGVEWIEAEVDSWTATGDLIEPVKTFIPGASNPGVVNFPSATTAVHRLRLKALYGNITDMTVTAFSELDGAGSRVPLPAQITLFSTGSFSRTKQALRATMPQRSPLSNVFDYVIFSEESLVKP